MISMNNQDLLKAILRSDLKSFVTKVFFDVSPSAQYLDNWHIDLICQELAQMINGQETRLIINIPPRYLKSIICSVALPAFILGHNPQSSIICAGLRGRPPRSRKRSKSFRLQKTDSLKVRGGSVFCLQNSRLQTNGSADRGSRSRRRRLSDKKNHIFVKNASQNRLLSARYRLE